MQDSARAAPGDSRSQVPFEPCVKVCLDTAPTNQPAHTGWRRTLLISSGSSGHRLLPRYKPVKAGPSLQPHDMTFRAASGCSSLVCRVDILPFAGLPLAGLHCHRRERSPRSPHEPGSRFRGLHAGRRPSNRQVPRGLVPKSITAIGLDVVSSDLDRSAAVHSRSTPRSGRTGSRPAFSQLAHHAS